MPYVVPDHGKLTQALALTKARVGQVDVWVAPEGTLPTAVSGVNGGWEYLGAMVPGSFRNPNTKEVFDLKTGTPATIKHSAAIEVGSEIEFRLHEPTFRGYEISNGGARMRPLFVSSPISTTVSAAPAPTAGAFTVASVTGLAAGDAIEVTLTGGAKVYSYISAIVGSEIQVFPALAAAPASTNAVKRCDALEIPLGGSDLAYSAVRAIFYDTNGTGVMTYLRKVRFMGIEDDYKDGRSNLELAVKGAAHGYTDPNYAGPITGTKTLLNAPMLAQMLPWVA